MHQGQAKVRLLIRGPQDKLRVDLVEGDAVDLFGRGSLVVDRIDLAPDGGCDHVALTFRPAGG